MGLFTVLILKNIRKKLLIESGDLCKLIIESALAGIVGGTYPAHSQRMENL